MRGSTPADGRKKGDIVAGGNTRLPSGKLLIARGDQRVAETCQLRVFCRVSVKKVGKGCAFGQLFELFGPPDELPDAPEKNHFDAKF